VTPVQRALANQIANVVSAFVARIMSVVLIAALLVLLATFALVARVIWVMTS
jgi:hypothetical protein